jgi:hypothetical protein
VPPDSGEPDASFGDQASRESFGGTESFGGFGYGQEPFFLMSCHSQLLPFSEIVDHLLFDA